MASLKQQAKKLRKREDKVQALAAANTPEARQERQRMLGERLWQNRQQPNMNKGQKPDGPKTLTARGKASRGYFDKDLT